MKTEIKATKNLIILYLKQNYLLSDRVPGKIKEVIEPKQLTAIPLPPKQEKQPVKPVPAIAKKPSPLPVNTSLRTMVEKCLPELKLRQEVYPDYHAAVLYDEENAAHLEFLKSLTAAIDKHLAPAQLIERKKFAPSPRIKWVLSTEKKEHGILLKPIEEYLQNPALKKELWQQLCLLLK